MGNPCTECGACCACFRVAFYWSETETFLGGAVPSAATVKIDPHRVAMAGTERRPPRCHSLSGTVGTEVTCTIYAERPTPCRDLMPSWADGTASDQCDRARRAHGLPALTSDDWIGPLEPRQPPSRRAGLR